jgi:hypothetical protein
LLQAPPAIRWKKWRWWWWLMVALAVLLLAVVIFLLACFSGGKNCIKR